MFGLKKSKEMRGGKWNKREKKGKEGNREIKFYCLI